MTAAGRSPESADRTTIRIHHDLALELSREERLRLLIRVMCELVAYGESIESDASAANAS